VAGKHSEAGPGGVMTGARTSRAAGHVQGWLARAQGVRGA